MKSNHRFLLTLSMVSFLSLSACGASTDGPSQESSSPSPFVSSDSSQNTDGSSSNQGHDAPLDDSSKDDDTNEPNQQEDTPVNQKVDYLKKLNEMEEADRYAEDTTTTIELEEQEAQRYKKWDEALNEIYGVLKEQLSTDEMTQLREEQRSWIKHRDEAAKESSLKYEGGTMESLEYVATQASLTRERCYELVAKYMK